MRWIALVQVGCAAQGSDATSWAKNAEDIPAPGVVLLGSGVQLWQSSANTRKS